MGKPVDVGPWLRRLTARLHGSRSDAAVWSNWWDLWTHSRKNVKWPVTHVGGTSISLVVQCSASLRDIGLVQADHVKVNDLTGELLDAIVITCAGPPGFI